MTTPAPADDGDELTQLVDANFPTMALVGKGANGIPRFLVAKQDAAGGLLEPGFVRDLIAKAEPEPGQPGRERVEMPSGVTLTGSPADIAAFIHKAAQRATEPRHYQYPVGGALDEVAKAQAAWEVVLKEKYSAADRRKMAGHEAMDDGSYPVKDREDLGHAIKAVGRGGASHNAIRRHVIARAKALGASSEIPDNWAADGSLKEDSVSKSDPVAKDMGVDGDGPDVDEGIDGLDPTVPLGAPDGDAPGDPNCPGSPAWEAIDAATACKWTSILARAKVAIGLLASREQLEAVSADPDDAAHAADLQRVCAAIDFAIGVLAPFAVAEQSEADQATEAMAAIGKAMAGDVAGPLDVIEALTGVAKAGRVLSAANEAQIRSAADALNKVLASLPQAPAADDTVTKEAAMAADTTATQPEAAAPAGPAEVAKAEDTAAPGTMTVGGATVPVAAPEGEPAPVAKAGDAGGGDAGDGGDGEAVALCVVYDAKGQPMGIVDSTTIVPVAGAAPAIGARDMDGDGDADGPCPEPGDMTPQPPAEAGTPADADAVAKSDDEDQAAEDAVAKEDQATAADTAAAAGTDSTITISKADLAATIAEAITAALDARAPAEGVAKGDAAAALAVAKQLEERLTIVENQPAAPKVFANGAVPPQNMPLRGQDGTPAGGPPVDIAKAAGLRQTLYSGTGPEQAQAAAELQQMADAQLAAIHGARR